jgi:hypothetical protein
MSAAVESTMTKPAGTSWRRDSHHPQGVRSPWREGTRTRVRELQSLALWLTDSEAASDRAEAFLAAMDKHLEAAHEAADCDPRRRLRYRDGALLQKAISNLDAAEADLLRLAPASYLLGQMPCLLNHVERHLPGSDLRRQEFERIATEVGLLATGGPSSGRLPQSDAPELLAIIDMQRERIVGIVRGASSAAMREQLQVRSFKNVLVATSVVMFFLAIGLAVLGAISPSSLPLCFQPEQGGQTVVVCPTGQSTAVIARGNPALQPQVDERVKTTVRPADIAVVETVGLMAAAVAAAAAVRRIRGSSEPHGLPVALAMLKLPTGALTAVLGLFLLRGQFIPGLSALDTSGQIIAWAIVLGYAQQLFTHFVDQQAQTVLNSVRSQQSIGQTVATVDRG